LWFVRCVRVRLPDWPCVSCPELRRRPFGTRLGTSSQRFVALALRSCLEGSCFRFALQRLLGEGFALPGGLGGFQGCRPINLHQRRHLLLCLVSPELLQL